MQLSELQKLILDGAALATGVIVVFITLGIVAKRKEIREESGVSLKVYLTLIGSVEVFWIVGVVMILSAMGVNVMQDLTRLEVVKFFSVVEHFDVKTMHVIGIIGWVGFAMNRGVSFVSPAYLLIIGGRKLPRFIFYSAVMEVSLEALATVVIFLALKFG